MYEELRQQEERYLSAYKVLIKENKEHTSEAETIYQGLRNAVYESIRAEWLSNKKSGELEKKLVTHPQVYITEGGIVELFTE